MNGRSRRKLDDWRKHYKDRLISLEEAAGIIKSGDHVVMPTGYSGEMPYAIVARENGLKNVKVEFCSKN